MSRLEMLMTPPDETRQDDGSMLCEKCGRIGREQVGRGLWHCEHLDDRTDGWGWAAQEGTST